MSVINVEGATGYIDTNFEGKAKASVSELKKGQDFVYIHVEAPDECGHRYEIDNKVKSIELIDEKILSYVIKELDGFDDYKIMILPDHATPLSLKTHTNDPVPFLIYDSSKPVSGVNEYTEETGKSTGLYIEIGHTIMEYFIKK